MRHTCITFISKMINTKILREKLDTYRLMNTLSLSIVLLLFLLNVSFAGNDGQELKGAYDKLVGLINGTGGKIIGIVSGLIGIIGCVVKFNYLAILSFFGVAIGIGSINLIVDTTITCLLYF